MQCSDGKTVAGARPCLVYAMAEASTRDVLTPAHRARLATLCEVPDARPLEDFSSPRAQALLARGEILVTGWGCPRIDPAVLARAPRLRLIAHAAGTVKTFMAPEVLERGIAVTHAAEANAVPVAEFTLAAILFANKRVLDFRRLYAEHRTERTKLPLGNPPPGNFRKAVGIVGASRIGRLVMQALRSHDLRVLLHDPTLSADQAAALGATLADLDALLPEVDILSLHAPSLPSTRHLVDRSRLALLRDGATLINTARGALVDQAALEAELRSGRINAFIDVTEPEVPPPSSPLYDLPNVFLTPHIAGALGTEQERLGRFVVQEIERHIAGLPLQSAITTEALSLMA
jgi:phosphoglycerate dehydrogenase-like enzyme